MPALPLLATLTPVAALAADVPFPGKLAGHQDLSSTHVATLLTDVQRGSIDGRDYLTIRIDGEATGPADCRGRVLGIDTSRASDRERRGLIEFIAVSAMMNRDSVLVTVPLTADTCRDGLPSFTDLAFLPASP